MFILPIGNDDLKREGIPLGTLALAILAVTLHVATTSRVNRDALAESDAAARAAETYYSSPWATLPEALLPTLPAEFRSRYEKNRKTTLEFDASPESTRPPPNDAASQVIRQLEANVALAQASAASGLDPTSDREVLRALLRATPPALRDAGQRAVDDAAAGLVATREDSLIRKVGLSREHRGLLPLLGHPWLHGGWFHLGLNVLFLIVAGSSLESVWRRTTLGVALLLSAVAAGLAHTTFSSASSLPLIGLSGGVAGLMGAVVARLTSTPITVLWGYWAGTLRWGTFEMPAYLVLPFWFAGELFYSLASEDAVTGTGHTAHVAGFLFGFVFAIAIRQSPLERRKRKFVPAGPSAPTIDPKPTNPKPAGTGTPSDLGPLTGPDGRTLTLYEQERARKRERWGIAAPGGRGLAKAEPNPAAMNLIANGTQLMGGASSRPPSPARPDVGIDSTGAAVPDVDGEGPVRGGAAVFGSLPTRPPVDLERPENHVPAASAGVAAEPAGAQKRTPAPEADRVVPLEPLPSRPSPSVALVFRRPDDGAPEAIPTDGAALLPTLASALRLEDSTIVSRYCDAFESGVLVDLHLSPPEWLRLARALRDRQMPGHAATIARRAHGADPRGPYASRSKLLEAELLAECGDGAGALGCLEVIASNHPNDPALEPARRLRQTILGGSA
ncbi:MAG: rhomboid family intramembrane serine protease [Myxococcales bacterium]|nr:rhomboid family intramembrane serine protease [Myxococcales bacterium]